MGKTTKLRLALVSCALNAGVLVVPSAFASQPTRAAGVTPPSRGAVKAAPAPARAASDQQLLAKKDRVAAATVTVPAKSCAGAVVTSQTRVLTAAHCIPEGAYGLDVVLRDGTRIAAKVDHIDRESDMAVLELDEAAQVTPLELGTELPQGGERVLFVGRVDRKSRAQVARVTHLGQCPSLPAVADAVFTTLKARPGDSGAPIVDQHLRVVGLIHGGAACHIAAPTAHLAHQLGDATAPSTPQPPAAAAPAPSGSGGAPDAASDTRSWGPVRFEKIPNGFRFELKFNWETPKRK